MNLHSGTRLLRDRGDRAFVVGLAGVALATLLLYGFLPPSFPTHYGADLRADHFVAKPLGPFVMIFAAAVVYVVLWPVRGLFRMLGIGVLEPVVKVVQVGLGLFMLAMQVLGCIDVLVRGLP